MTGREPIHRYQHNQRIQALALGSEGATVATASGFEVKVESPDDKGFWQTTGTFEIQKLVSLQATQLRSRSSWSANYFWYGLEESYKNLTRVLHEIDNSIIS